MTSIARFRRPTSCAEPSISWIWMAFSAPTTPRSFISSKFAGSHSSEVAGLNKRFWNHGGAPVLVLIAPDQIHVYSGLCLPPADPQAQDRLPSLVTVIDRVATALREFLLSVESGEFFHQNIPFFNPDHRVDRDLLDNLKDTREKLDDVTNQRLSPQILDALLCRLVFTCYLFDRGVIKPGYLSALGLQWRLPPEGHSWNRTATGRKGRLVPALYAIGPRLQRRPVQQ